MTCSYLNFYKCFLHFELFGQEYDENKSIHLNSWHHSHSKQKDTEIHQNSKKWYLLWRTASLKWFWGSFSQFLLLWLRYQCFWGSSEDQHKDVGVACQLTKTDNFIATPMKEHILAVYYLLAGDTSQVSLFFLT